MREGTGKAVLVFGGVLVVAGGVGWLLYEAGKPEPDTFDAEGRPVSKQPKKGAKRPLDVPPDPTPMPRAKPPAQPDVRFDIPGHDDLKLRNWRQVAISWSEMHDAAIEIWRDGSPDPAKPEDAKRLAKFQEITDRFRMYVVEAPHGWGDVQPSPDEPPPPPVGPVTNQMHPAFLVNLIGALVDRAGEPLTAEQSRRFLEIAKKHSPIFEEKPPQPTEEDWRLEYVVAQAKKTDDFNADVFSILTTKQAEIVSPAAYRGHGGLDPLGAGVQWGTILRAMPFTDIEKLIDEITDILANDFDIHQRPKDMRPVVEKWAKGLVIETGDTMEFGGTVRVSRAQGAVRDMLELLKRCLTDIDPPLPDPARVKRVPIAFVPLRRPN